VKDPQVKIATSTSCFAWDASEAKPGSESSAHLQFSAQKLDRSHEPLESERLDHVVSSYRVPLVLSRNSVNVSFPRIRGKIAVDTLGLYFATMRDSTVDGIVMYLPSVDPVCPIRASSTREGTNVLL
jgi:hypothetical protein